MAKAATKDNVREVGEAQYQSARNIIKQDIARLKAAQQKSAGDIGNLWAKIEGFGLNKIGAQMFNKLVNMEDTAARDAWRTLKKLTLLEGIDDKDLVEQIQDGDIDKEELAEMTAPKPAPEPKAAETTPPPAEVEPVKRGRGRPPKAKPADVPFSQALKDAAEPVSNVTPIKRGFGAADSDLDKAGDGGAALADEANAFLKDRKKLGIAVPDAL